jgi:hypothetical protein
LDLPADGRLYVVFDAVLPRLDVAGVFASTEADALRSVTAPTRVPYRVPLKEHISGMPADVDPALAVIFYGVSSEDIPAAGVGGSLVPEADAVRPVAADTVSGENIAGVLMPDRDAISAVVAEVVVLEQALLDAEA